jgi:hypothetical protein
MGRKGGKKTGSASRSSSASHRPATVPELGALIAAAKHVRRQYTRNELPLESDDDEDDEEEQPTADVSVDKPDTPNWTSVGVFQDATVRKVRACTLCVSVHVLSICLYSMHTPKLASGCICAALDAGVLREQA